MTEKNSACPVTIRDLEGVREERLQNRWCHLCRRSYYEDPRRAEWARYTRRVQRKGLDLYAHLGDSLRRVVECLEAEINSGTGCSLIWNPLLRGKGLPARQAFLSHTSLWRWVQLPLAGAASLPIR